MYVGGKLQHCQFHTVSTKASPVTVTVTLMVRFGYWKISRFGAVIYGYILTKRKKVYTSIGKTELHLYRGGNWQPIHTRIYCRFIVRINALRLIYRNGSLDLPFQIY